MGPANAILHNELMGYCAARGIYFVSSLRVLCAYAGALFSGLFLGYEQAGIYIGGGVHTWRRFSRDRRG